MLSRIGLQIEKDPSKAHETLTRLFARRGTVGQIARSEQVAQSTVSRWIERLIEQGFADPRLTVEGARQPRPRQTDLDEQAEREPDRVRARLERLLRPRRGEGARQARVRAAAELGVSEITIRRVAAKVGLR